MHNSKLLGRLGYLTANPHKAEPGELERLTDRYLTQGRQRRTRTDWLTARQQRRREQRENVLGDQVASVSLYPQPGCALHQLG